MTLSCPIPLDQYPLVTLAHGGGGRLMNQLIQKIFLETLSDSKEVPHDGVRIPTPSSESVFTTDSFVVRPLFFPGGDIGTLAVYGTVNDLAMCGARASALSLGVILEEGFPFADLWRIAQSIRAASCDAGVSVVTGDTKVVEKGKGDGVYLNTAGIGYPLTEALIGPTAIQEGDIVILSGDVGRHGIAVMAAREGLEFETSIESDCCNLFPPVERLIHQGIDIHCLRDLTRGGLVSALNELAEGCRSGIHVVEESIPVHQQVAGACELLGLDPLSVANEGRFILFVPPNQADHAVEILRTVPQSLDAVRIGVVGSKQSPIGAVTLCTRIGVSRILPMPSGHQLPRIC